MNALAEALLREAERRKDADWVGHLGKVVSQAVWPFDLGTATVLIDDATFDFRTRTIVIELEGLRSYPFKYVFNERLIYDAYDPHTYVYELIREPLFNHFRYRPSLPVDDHIVLGED